MIIQVMIEDLILFYKPLLSSEHVYLSYYFGGLAIFLVIYIIYYIATYFEFKRNLKEI